MSELWQTKPTWTTGAVARFSVFVYLAGALMGAVVAVAVVLAAR
jgi:hypothetical protein